jgi:hypothetical protein
VPAIRAPHMRLIGTGTTTIDGVPTAVLAYRRHDRLEVQYLVPHHAFFSPRGYAKPLPPRALRRRQGEDPRGRAPTNGPFLVGEFTAAELAAMRM